MARRTSYTAFGVTTYLTHHPAVRRLKAKHGAGIAHGYKVWASSWGVMEFLDRNVGIVEAGNRVIDLGCGWGMTGIYCAKTFGAQVCGVDVDEEVFPYVDLHAGINGVKLSISNRPFDQITTKMLKGTDLVVGSDICFWPHLRVDLEKLIGRAMDAKVKTVLIADPGRYPFIRMADRCVSRYHGEVRWWDCQVPKPHRVHLLILRGAS